MSNKKVLIFPENLTCCQLQVADIFNNMHEKDKGCPKAAFV
ncbi:MAG: hypothetical protein JWQ38_2771 [Flavipsychrobacter sp.]|nr:hypothetical protein [Flavipsychrobacter sp.]